MLSCFYITLALTWCIQPRIEITEPKPQVISRSLRVWEVLDFIAKWEAPNGPALISYKDRSGRYSIWFWNRSFEWEKISHQEAWKRFYAVVSQSMAIVKKDFPGAPDPQIVALTSLYFNCWGGYKRVKNEWLHVYLEKWFCEPAWYGGLTKRRAAERALIALTQE